MVKSSSFRKMSATSSKMSATSSKTSATSSKMSATSSKMSATSSKKSAFSDKTSSSSRSSSKKTMPSSKSTSSSSTAKKANLVGTKKTKSRTAKTRVRTKKASRIGTKHASRVKKTKKANRVGTKKSRIGTKMTNRWCTVEWNGGKWTVIQNIYGVGQHTSVSHRLLGRPLKYTYKTLKRKDDTGKDSMNEGMNSVNGYNMNDMNGNSMNGMTNGNNMNGMTNSKVMNEMAPTIVNDIDGGIGHTAGHTAANVNNMEPLNWSHQTPANLGCQTQASQFFLESCVDEDDFIPPATQVDLEELTQPDHWPDGTPGVIMNSQTPMNITVDAMNGAMNGNSMNCMNGYNPIVNSLSTPINGFTTTTSLGTPKTSMNLGSHTPMTILGTQTIKNLGEDERVPSGDGKNGIGKKVPVLQSVELRIVGDRETKNPKRENCAFELRDLFVRFSSERKKARRLLNNTFPNGWKEKVTVKKEANRKLNMKLRLKEKIRNALTAKDGKTLNGKPLSGAMYELVKKWKAIQNPIDQKKAIDQYQRKILSEKWMRHTAKLKKKQRGEANDEILLIDVPKGRQMDEKIRSFETSGPDGKNSNYHSNFHPNLAVRNALRYIQQCSTLRDSLRPMLDPAHKQKIKEKTIKNRIQVQNEVLAELASELKHNIMKDESLPLLSLSFNGMNDMNDMMNDRKSDYDRKSDLQEKSIVEAEDKRHASEPVFLPQIVESESIFPPEILEVDSTSDRLRQERHWSKIFHDLVELEFWRKGDYHPATGKRGLGKEFEGDSLNASNHPIAVHYRHFYPIFVEVIRIQKVKTLSKKDVKTMLLDILKDVRRKCRAGLLRGNDGTVCGTVCNVSMSTSSSGTSATKQSMSDRNPVKSDTTSKSVTKSKKPTISKVKEASIKSFQARTILLRSKKEGDEGTKNGSATNKKASSNNTKKSSNSNSSTSKSSNNSSTTVAIQPFNGLLAMTAEMTAEEQQRVKHKKMWKNSESDSNQDQSVKDLISDKKFPEDKNYETPLSKRQKVDSGKNTVCEMKKTVNEMKTTTSTGEMKTTTSKLKMIGKARKSVFSKIKPINPTDKAIANLSKMGDADESDSDESNSNESNSNESNSDESDLECVLERKQMVHKQVIPKQSNQNQHTKIRKPVESDSSEESDEDSPEESDESSSVVGKSGGDKSNGDYYEHEPCEVENEDSGDSIYEKDFSLGESSSSEDSIDNDDWSDEEEFLNLTEKDLHDQDFPVKVEQNNNNCPVKTEQSEADSEEDSSSSDESALEESDEEEKLEEKLSEDIYQDKSNVYYQASTIETKESAFNAALNASAKRDSDTKKASNYAEVEEVQHFVQNPKTLNSKKTLSYGDNRIIEEEERRKIQEDCWRMQQNDWAVRQDDWRMQQNDWAVRQNDWRMQQNDWAVRQNDWRMQQNDWQMRQDDWRMQQNDWAVRQDDWRMPQNDWQMRQQCCEHEHWRRAENDWHQERDVHNSKNSKRTLSFGKNSYGEHRNRENQYLHWNKEQRYLHHGHREGELSREGQKNRHREEFSGEEIQDEYRSKSKKQEGEATYSSTMKGEATNSTNQSSIRSRRYLTIAQLRKAPEGHDGVRSRDETAKEYVTRSEEKRALLEKTEGQEECIQHTRRDEKKYVTQEKDDSEESKNDGEKSKNYGEESKKVEGNYRGEHYSAENYRESKRERIQKKKEEDHWESRRERIQKKKEEEDHWESRRERTEKKKEEDDYWEWRLKAHYDWYSTVRKPKYPEYLFSHWMTENCRTELPGHVEFKKSSKSDEDEESSDGQQQQGFNVVDNEEKSEEEQCDEHCDEKNRFIETSSEEEDAHQQEVQKHQQEADEESTSSSYHSTEEQEVPQHQQDVPQHQQGDWSDEESTLSSYHSTEESNGEESSSEEENPPQKRRSNQRGQTNVQRNVQKNVQKGRGKSKKGAGKKGAGNKLKKRDGKEQKGGGKKGLQATLKRNKGASAIAKRDNMLLESVKRHMSKKTKMPDELKEMLKERRRRNRQYNKEQSQKASKRQPKRRPQKQNSGKGQPKHNQQDASKRRPKRRPQDQKGRKAKRNEQQPKRSKAA